MLTKGRVKATKTLEAAGIRDGRDWSVRIGEKPSRGAESLGEREAGGRGAHFALERAADVTLAEPELTGEGFDRSTVERPG